MVTDQAARASPMRQSRVFSRFARLIAMKQRKRAGSSAPGLAAAIARAKAVNMPKRQHRTRNQERHIKDSGTLERGSVRSIRPCRPSLSSLMHSLTIKSHHTRNKTFTCTSKHRARRARRRIAGRTLKTGMDYIPHEPLISVAERRRRKT